MRDLIAYTLVVCLGIILVVHFALFWVYGTVNIYEFNRVVLALETLMGVAIIAFGFERLVGKRRDEFGRRRDVGGSQVKHVPGIALLHNPR